MRKTFLWILIPLFNELTLVTGLFFYFSGMADTGIITYSAPRYLLCGVAAALSANWLPRKSPTVQLLAIVITGLVLLNNAVMLPSLANAHSPFAWGSAVLVFAYPAGRAYYLAYNPANVLNLLRYFEISLVGNALFYLVQLGAYKIPFEFGWLFGGVLLLNLFSLSALRIEERKDRRATGSMQRIMILGVLFLLILSITVLFALLILPSGREAVFLLLSYIWKAVSFIFNQVKLLFAGFATLFPEQEYVEMDWGWLLPKFAIHESGGVTGEANSLVAVSLLGLGLVIVFVPLIRRFLAIRRKRLAWKSLPKNATYVKTQSPTLPSLLFAMLQRGIRRITYVALLLRRRDTPPGIFIRLETRGKRCGLPRVPGQTPRAYLDMLSSRLARDEETVKAFVRLRDQVDAICFSQRSPSNRQNGNDTALLWRATRANKHGLRLGTGHHNRMDV